MALEKVLPTTLTKGIEEEKSQGNLEAPLVPRPWAKVIS